MRVLVINFLNVFIIIGVFVFLLLLIKGCLIGVIVFIRVVLGFICRRFFLIIGILGLNLEIVLVFLVNISDFLFFDIGFVMNFIVVKGSFIFFFCRKGVILVIVLGVVGVFLMFLIRGFGVGDLIIGVVVF